MDISSKKEMISYLLRMANDISIDTKMNYSSLVVSYHTALGIFKKINVPEQITGVDLDIRYSTYVCNPSEFRDRIHSVIFLIIALVEKHS